ncbi:MAG: AAA family ATPase [Candidatus Hydrogenedentes bacterium]|nr:AAA family ATPase [Candidatus Hydrogenedentota bacterium]
MSVFFLTVVIAVTLATLTAPSIYRSDALILIRLGKESVAMDPSVASSFDPIVSVGQSRDAELLSEIEILKSRELAEQVVEQFGPGAYLAPDPEDAAGEGLISFTVRKLNELQRSFSKQAGDVVLDEEINPMEDDAITQFSEGLLIELNKKSNIISVSFESFHPRLAKDSLTTLLDRFLDKHIEVNQVSGSLDFFERERTKSLEAVTVTEDKLRVLMRENAVSSYKDDQFFLAKQLDTLELSLKEAQHQHAESSARLASLEKDLDHLPMQIPTEIKSGLPNLTANNMRQELFDLRIQEQRLLGKYEADSVPVLSIREEIAKAEAMLQAEAPSLTESSEGVNTVHQTVLTNMYQERATEKALKARLEELRELVGTTRTELQKLVDLGVEVSRLERDLALNEANYRTYAESYEQARINRAQETERLSNISYVQMPTLPVEPLRPKRLLNLALGLFLAFFGSLTLAFIAEFLDSSFKKPEEIEGYLEIPVFASISIPGKAGRSSVNPVKVRVQQIKDSWDIPIPTRNQYYNLRDTLVAASRKLGGKHCFQITSCNAGEGVTTTTANLGFTLTSGGEDRVLLVDGNLRDPELHRIFKLDEGPGLLDLLTTSKPDWRAMVKPTPVKNLDLLPAGRLKNELTFLTEARLYETDAFLEALQAWKEKYDYVLIDSPPAAVNSSSIALAGKADAVLWVIQAEYVRQPVAKYVHELLTRENAVILGSVFNKRQFHIPRWLYRYL